MKTNVRKAIRTVALGGALAAFSSAAFAATDGLVGFNSTGDLNINLVVSDEVRISGMADILLPFTGVDAIGTSPACVYRNTNSIYQIVGTGSGAGGAYTLAGGGFSVPYSVTYDDGSGAVALPNGAAVAADGADTTSTTCAGTGVNGTIEVTVLATDAAVLPAGGYAGILYLTVAPI